MSATRHDRTPRARHWPDRNAYRHRKRAHRLFYVVAALVLVLPWFGYRYVRDAIRGEPPEPPGVGAAPTGAPAPAGDAGRAIAVGARPVTADGHIAAVRTAAAAGDARAIRTSVDAMNDASRQALPLVERGRSVEREAARTAVQRLPGVRAAGWIDRTRLLAVVARDDAPGQATMIEAICRRLQPVGDTVGVVVSVQGDAAGRGRPPRETSRRCAGDGSAGIASAPQPRALARPPAPAGGAALRGQGDDAAPAPAQDDADARARNEDSMRILEETTPEM